MFQDTIRIGVFFLILILSCEGWAATRQFTQPMQFELVGNGGNCADCEWIRADGVITKETPALFKAYLAREGDAPFRIHFDSSGGNLEAALELGRIIRSRDHLITEVRRTQKSNEGDWHDSIPGVCYDACIFAFLGGSQRVVDPKSKVGFTSAGAKAENETQFDAPPSPDRHYKKISLYLNELGFSSKALLNRLMASKMFLMDFSRSDIVDWKIDNSSQATGFTSWEVSRADDHPVLIARSKDHRSLVKLYCYSKASLATPKIYINFIQTFRSGYAAEQLENIRDSLEAIWITIAGRARLVDGSDLDVSYVQDDLVIRVALPHELGRQLTVAGATIFVKPDGLPDAYRDVLRSPNTGNPLVIDAELMRLLSQDCAR